MIALESIAVNRFLCIRGGVAKSDFEGYFLDPEHEHGKLVNPDILTSEELQDAAVLVVLGEPGMGKTTYLEQLSEDPALVGKPLRVRLRTVDNSDALRRSLFEHPEYLEAIERGRPLSVLIDDLDECMLRIEALTALLIDGFSQDDVSNVRVVIASRTSAWRSELEKGLSDIWGSERVKICELSPLRKKDVQKIVSFHGIDSDEFVKKVKSQDVVALAMRPITLQMLVSAYESGGELPQNRGGLYEEACISLVREPREDMRELYRNRNINYAVDHALEYAGLLAATMLLSDTKKVTKNSGAGRVDGAIDVELFDEARLDEYSGVPLGQAMRFVVDCTSLFNAREAGQYGWGHFSYAEYLAARFLAAKLDDVTRLLSLLYPLGKHRGMPPQLEGLAAWLVYMRPELFEHIVQISPEPLLRSDVASLADSQKADLVSSLISACEEGRVLDEVQLREHYKKLRYPKLADQLLTKIVDKNLHPIVRRMSIDIAESTDLVELIETFYGIAGDCDDDYHIRSEALSAVRSLAVRDIEKAPARQYVMGSCDDPDDQLKGHALRILWPGILSAEELFKCVRGA